MKLHIWADFPCISATTTSTRRNFPRKYYVHECSDGLAEVTIIFGIFLTPQGQPDPSKTGRACGAHTTINFFVLRIFKVTREQKIWQTVLGIFTPLTSGVPGIETEMMTK